MLDLLRKLFQPPDFEVHPRHIFHIPRGYLIVDNRDKIRKFTHIDLNGTTLELTIAVDDKGITMYEYDISDPDIDLEKIIDDHYS